MKRANLLANYGGAAFVAATQILLIPLYLKGLGDHQWGLLSALVAVSTALLILEAGVSLAVARSFSVGMRVVVDAIESFRRLERRYVASAAALCALALLLSDTLSSFWMHDAGPNGATLLRISVLMGALQIVGALYRSVLIGLGEQVRFNVLLVSFTTLRHVCGLTSMLFFSDVTAVATAFALSFAAEATWRRRAALGALGRQVAAQGDLARLAPLGPTRGAAVLALAGAVGALGTQVDRLFMSAKLSAVDFGHYAIAATLSLAALQLIYPLSTALLPSLNRFTARDSGANMLGRTFAILALLLVLIWLGTVVLWSGVLAWWLSSARLAETVMPLFALHLLGTSLNALCVPFYMALLARHMDGRILSANALAVILQLIVLWMAAPRHGTMAGSISWVAANAFLLSIYFLFYMSIPRYGERRIA